MKLITSQVMDQEFAAPVALSDITDRPAEHLGESDRAAVLYRRSFRAQPQRALPMF